MAAAGFPDRRFPDGRVLRLCARAEGMTASEIGRALGITRQGAGKIVAGLAQRSLVAVESSRGDAREKVVRPTSRGRDYLGAQRKAARAIDHEVEQRIGAGALEYLAALGDLLAGEQDEMRMRDYLRHAVRYGDDAEPT